MKYLNKLFMYNVHLKIQFLFLTDWALASIVKSKAIIIPVQRNKVTRGFTRADSDK
jgi:hypothetical protein